MNREEILAMSREENGDKDLFELEVNKKANGIGVIAGAIICGILFTIEIIVCGTYNLGLWSIIAVMNSGIYLYSGITLKDKGKLAVGIIMSILGVMSIVYAVSHLFAASTIL